MKLINITLALIVASIITSCSGVRNCRAPELDMPAAIVDNSTDTLTAADIGWWEFYGDSTLCKIIKKTLDNNKELRQAMTRVEELRQVYRIDRAAMLPSIGVNIGANHETNDYYDERYIPDPEFDVKASLSWEADLWGKFRWGKREGESRWKASIEDFRALKVSLIAEVAKAYFSLIALDNELAIVKRTLVNRSEGMAKAKLRFEGGLTSELVYQQTKVEYATAAVMVPNLESRIAAIENALAVLMGEFPGNYISRSDTIAELRVKGEMPTGLPSQLLERRPDIRAKKKLLKAAMAKVGVTYAERFPPLTFSLTGGWENNDLPTLFKSPFSYVAGSIAGPIFQFGQKKAKYKAAEAAYEQAVLNYEQRVLEAFEETNNAVINYRKARETAILRTDSRNAAKKYVELAELQYRAGSINYIEVLDAQRRYLDAQINQSNSVRDEHLALVELYKALGGGWN